MRVVNYRQNFAQLFCLYKSRSQLVSLEQLGDALANMGLVLDSSTLSHWQRGMRVPRDRQVLLKLIKVFYLNQGIRNTAEANKLLTSCQQFSLTDRENNYICSQQVGAVPEEQPPTDSSKSPPATDAITIVFNMIMPAKLNEYLEFQARVKKVSKAAVVRQILDREMKNSPL